jgi:transcription termination factor NusB
MQMLFQWDMSRQDPAKLEAKFWRAAKAADNTRAFANKLFEGAAKDADELDALIVQHAQNWRLERMALTARCCDWRFTSCELLKRRREWCSMRRWTWRRSFLRKMRGHL